jgi:hypothetical protein
MIGPWNKIGFRQIAFGGGDKRRLMHRDEKTHRVISVASRHQYSTYQANVNRISGNGGGSNNNDNDNDPAPTPVAPVAATPVAATPTPVAVTSKEAKPGTPATPIPEGFKPPDGPYWFGSSNVDQYGHGRNVDREHYWVDPP